MENAKIYVGNLPFSTTEEDLKDMFAQYGDIQQAKLITDHETGRSRGFAFVTFESADAMKASLEKNGEEIEGRQLRVNEAEDRRQRN